MLAFAFNRWTKSWGKPFVFSPVVPFPLSFGRIIQERIWQLRSPSFPLAATAGLSIAFGACLVGRGEDGEYWQFSQPASLSTQFIRCSFTYSRIEQEETYGKF